MEGPMFEAALGRTYKPNCTTQGTHARLVCLVSYHVVRTKSDPGLFSLRFEVRKRERMVVRRARWLKQR